MGSPIRILVVEDETRIAEVVQSYLEREGHMVARAATGEVVEGILARRRSRHHVALALEVALHHFRYARLVLDDQDADGAAHGSILPRHARPPPARPGAKAI